MRPAGFRVAMLLRACMLCNGGCLCFSMESGREYCRACTPWNVLLVMVDEASSSSWLCTWDVKFWPECPACGWIGMYNTVC